MVRCSILIVRKRRVAGNECRATYYGLRWLRSAAARMHGQTRKQDDRKSTSHGILPFTVLIANHNLIPALAADRGNRNLKVNAYAVYSVCAKSSLSSEWFKMSRFGGARLSIVTALILSQQEIC
jgi:hypothetical protein